jgi:ABC-type branched-subunit amino acid transport system permease subunit
MGGVGNICGPIIGAVILITISEISRIYWCGFTLRLFSLGKQNLK